MKGRRFFLLLAMALILPCMVFSQGAAAEVADSDMEPFLGKWKGTHDECRSATECETRNVDMTITRDQVTYVLGPSGAGMGRHSKATKGPVSKTYPVTFVKDAGGSGFFFVTTSGTKIMFRTEKGKLVGKGTGGRFGITYRLSKAGS